MNKLAFAALIALPMSLTGLGGAQAFVPAAGIGETPSGVEKVRLVCNENRCINPETRAYTESSCNYSGCYPSSGLRGYDVPGGGYAYGYRGHGRHWWRHHGDYD